MSFVDVGLYGYILVILIIYYISPIKYRWGVLLVGSICIYRVYTSWGALFLLVGTSTFTYFTGIYLEKVKSFKRKIWLFIGIVLCSLPFCLLKYSANLFGSMYNNMGWIVPLGISFYTMQLIAYMIDVYNGKIAAEKNWMRFLLFGTYFPQILQGPIPRYNYLSEELFNEHRFKELEFIKGMQLIIWGGYLKLMIADKTAIVVNEIFDNYYSYSGCDYLVAGVLYSVQLYADFLSCTSFAQGISALFGIKLSDNFKHPYFSISIKDFWRRWHITFSEWLRDYIYIPLGGNRKGRVRQKLNLIIVFAVSGLWHGPGVNYLCWGLMHGIYQIVGSATYYFRERVYQVLHIEEGNVIKKYNKIIWTFIFVMFAWIIFRAENLTIGIHMIRSIFNTHNIWVLFDDSLLTLGLSWKEYVILGISIWIMKKVSSLQESGICIRDYILSQHIILRWIIYILAIAAIITFGSYGYGFDQQAFIYGGF